MIYCSTITCSLVSLKLGVKKEYLRPLELEKRNTILCNGYPIEVILTEANHCPGAVCILFIFPNGKVFFFNLKKEKINNKTNYFNILILFFRKSFILVTFVGMINYFILQIHFKQW